MLKHRNSIVVSRTYRTLKLRLVIFSCLANTGVEEDTSGLFLQRSKPYAKLLVWLTFCLHRSLCLRVLKVCSRLSAWVAKSLFLVNVNMTELSHVSPPVLHLPRLNEQCERDFECQMRTGELAVCRRQRCKCAPGYYIAGNTTCEPREHSLFLRVHGNATRIPQYQSSVPM